nr:heparinase II/III family protein [Achromobacter animicus]
MVHKADEILSQGWSPRGYETVHLDRPLPWKMVSQEKRSHNFHIHCLDMLDPLLRAHSQTLNPKYLTASLAVIIDWIEKNSDCGGADVSPFAWYDMAVGMRAYRLAYAYEQCESNELLSDELRGRLWGSLEQHAAYLANDKNIAFHNNHGYYQVAGQIAMGRRFAPQSAVMKQALAQGRSRLKVMLEQQFASDGVHREHSPDYHRMVYDTLKALIDAGLIEDEETIEFAARVEEALSWFVFPNQHIVNFGDSDFRSLSRSEKIADKKWCTPEMKFWASGGLVGGLSKETTRTFKEGGYWVARKPGEDASDLSSYSYLALNAAFHSRTHKHADDLSFVWFDRKTNLLVDAGRYGYIGKTEQESALWKEGHWYSDPWRVYCESTRAHNTLEFDGRNGVRKGAKPYGSALGRSGSDASGLVWAEAECKQFSSIRHARVLCFMPGQWLVVFDWFHDNADSRHAVKQWFHLGHELQLLADREQFLASVPGSAQFLRVASLLAGPKPSQPHIGEEQPAIQGWWSPRERDIVPNYAFNYSLSDAATGAFATLFSFSDVLTPDTEWSKVNQSGRKGQFRWRDANQTHELWIERPADGEMTVKYASR